MKKIRILDGLIYLALLVIFLTVLFCGTIEYACKREFLMNNITLLLFGMFVLIILCYFYIKRQRVSDHLKDNHKKRTFLFWLFICILQITFCFLLFFYTGWDAGGQVIPTARNIALHLNEPIDQAYFSRYPNNTTLVLLYAFIIKIGVSISPVFRGVSQSVFLLFSFQCILSSFAGYLLSQIIKDLTGSDSLKKIAILFYLVLVGFSPWLIVPYSDSTALIFPIAILRIFQLLSNKKHSLIKVMAIAFLTFWGYKIKPQVAIVTIAIVMVVCLEWIKSRKFGFNLDVIKKMAAVIGITAMSVFSYKTMITLSPFELNKDLEFGVPHFFMMGLNEEHNGVWCSEDVDFSAACINREVRNSENIRVANERIKEYGASGMVNHLLKKTMTLYNDSTFAFGNEGNFYVAIASWDNVIVNQLRSVFYDTGDLYIYSSSIRQLVWIFILFAMLLSIGNKNDSLTKRVTLFAIAGITLFELLFEVRARYLFIFVPIYIVMAAEGMQCIYNYVKEKINRGFGYENI